MEKNNPNWIVLTCPFKINLSIKLTVLLLLVSFLKAEAKNYDLNSSISLTLENVSLKEALDKIEADTEFRFLYRDINIELERKVSINVSKKSIEQVLNELFKNSRTTYNIYDNRQILLMPLSEKILEKAAPVNSKQIQDKISGTVVDAEGTPIPGVSVVIQGTVRGVATDFDGLFTIEASSSDILVFSSIGFATYEVAVGNKKNIDIVMQAEASSLEEVVIVGYGTQRKSDLTGAVGVLSSEDLLKAPVNNSLQGLQGKVAGVNVFLNSGSPSGAPKIVIRGVGTINSSSSPLYVVDGVAMDDIQYLNPNDIERMEVLKDASSASIYGARGANGVVLITTKRGAKGGKMIVGYDGFLSVGQMQNKMDLLNSEEWLDVVRIGMENTPKYRPGAPAPTFTTNDPRLFDSSGKPLYDTDWQDEATRTAYSNNHQLSIQSGNENSSIGAFLNYSHMEGIMLNNDVDRISGKIAYDVSPKDWLSFGLNLLVNNVKEKEFEEDGGGQVPRRTMIEMPSIFPVKFPDGTYSNSFDIEDAYNIEAMANPVHVLETQERLWERNQIFGNVFAKFNILPGLEFRTQFGFDKRINVKQEYSPRDLVNISAPNGFARIYNSKSTYWQQENYLTYKKEVDDHRFNGMLGLSWQENTFESSDIQARGFSDDFFKYNNIGSANNPSAPVSNYNKWALNSYFLRAGYTLQDKYMLTLTGRVDGSSRFGANNKYGFFPSAGLGWMLSEESFLADSDKINRLKLRASYGITGNTEIPAYSSLATVSSGTILLNGTRVASSSVNRLSNPDLEWEKTSQFDIGLDFGAYNNRIRFEFDYYYKETTDLLLDRPVPYASGFVSVRDNIGAVSNEGIEAMLVTQNITRPDFNWETSFNINFNKNTIQSLGENDEDILPGPNWVSGSQTILRVGKSLSSFWGYERLGTWGTDEVAEAALVGAVPGEAKRSEDKKILGKGLPDFTGSFTNTFNYKNFDFTADIQFVGGVDIMQQFYHSTEDRSGIANGLASILYKGWTEQNQNTMVQEIRNQSYAGQNSQVDSHWVVNGSYIRGNLFSLGYSFTETMLDKLGLNRLRVYASLENAFVIHSDDFQGYDPEATSWGGNQWGQNIFFFQYPKPRTFTLGCSLKF
ncbi:TonB-dependent receptor P3 [Arenibacter antarcticus]|uniref:SusC/RagA family TonB-linked outer membrane protein n=1 Tax=Arenibacter antarcticus TaxID=2040469 RepID=A0ABW5VHG3_9FLAO|nr:SusC/RagA family TonB-linked outer membrane protein [Arenibacter sp. H213]MCM4167288.1 SusC/RagA family TonB-linked outer membrane protein [Arenibacter sp. H213]